MAFSITNSFMEQFNILFQEMLNQKGSFLMPYTRMEQVVGNSQIIRQFDTGDATIGELNSSGVTEFSPILYDHRKLEPRPISKTISLNEIDMIRQGQPPVEQLAATCSQSCGAALDKIIINGIGGMAKTQSSGDIALPLNQYICVDTKQYDNKGAELSGQGLTTQKVSFAVAALRAKYNIPQLVCVCSNRAMGQLMTDERAASALFNRTQAMANGFMTPFAGVDFFVTSEKMPKAKAHLCAGGNLITADSSAAKASNSEVELAYIYSKDQIVLGCSKEFNLKSAEDAHRNFDLIFQCVGMYDAVRMQEESVIAIEVNTGSAAITA